MFKFFYINLFLLIILSINVFASSKIYLIRHAIVQIENPGWCNTQTTYTYKDDYNKYSVEVFEQEIVLKKIEHPETIDTVFCSPQLRAIQTANLLFDKQVILRINKNLKELQYTIISFPVLKLPVRIWQAISLISWMASNNQEEYPTYRQRKQDLEIYSNEIITYAETHGKSVVVAHGVVNRELIKILKKKGWKFEHRDGYGNLSVNCLVK